MDEGSETEPEDDDEEKGHFARSKTLDSQQSYVDVKAEESQLDPALADWFKVDEEDTKDDGDDDSVTEPESDNMDVEDIDADVGDPDDDEWYSIPAEKVRSTS